VDVETGILETSYTISGEEGSFLDLQDQLVLGIISRLDLPVTENERRTLLAKRNTDADARKMLLEAEGGARPAAPPPPGAGAPRSSLLRWLAALGPKAARAADADAEAHIKELIDRYRKATAARDLDAIASLHIDFTPEQRAAQQRYFDNARDLK